DAHHRGARVDSQRFRFVRLGQRRLEPLLCTHRHIVVERADQLVDGAVERLVDQPGVDSDCIRATLERDRLAVRKAHALDRIDASAERALVRFGAAFYGAEYACARGEPETAELIGERGCPRELELRLGDERAAVAPLAALEEPVPLELAERLPECHPADAEAL